MHGLAHRKCLVYRVSTQVVKKLKLWYGAYLGHCVVSNNLHAYDMHTVKFREFGILLNHQIENSPNNVCTHMVVSIQIAIFPIPMESYFAKFNARQSYTRYTI